VLCYTDALRDHIAQAHAFYESLYVKTDDYGMKVAEKEVHVHDFHATILDLRGFDHTRLTFRHAGRDLRLTDVHVKAVLA
jgi:uncharacterized protein DUF1501